MSVSEIILWVYGGLMIIGGFIGSKAGSKVSLIMGLISGAIILGLMSQASQENIGAYKTISVVTGILATVFTIRLVKTQKFMPSGMLLIFSITALMASLMMLRV